jgi:hypothetical protein
LSPSSLVVVCAISSFFPFFMPHVPCFAVHCRPRAKQKKSVGHFFGGRGSTSKYSPIQRPFPILLVALQMFNRSPTHAICRCIRGDIEIAFSFTTSAAFLFPSSNTDHCVCCWPDYAILRCCLFGRFTFLLSVCAAQTGRLGRQQKDALVFEACVPLFFVYLGFILLYFSVYWIL